MKRGRLLLIGLCLVLVVAAIFAGSAMVQGAGCSLVTIRGRDNIEPLTLSVKVGGCVVWMNYTGGATKGQDVRVIFKEGQKCKDMSDQAFGYSMDENKCYVTNWLKYGENGVLMFTKPGALEYEVMFKGGGSTSGTLVVK